MGFVEELKWWHWIVISLVLGAALGYVNSNGGSLPPVHATLTQIVFEEKLLSTARDSSGSLIPWISNVVVHPVTALGIGPDAPKAQLVTFSCYSEPAGASKSGSTDSYSIMLPCPYEPRARIGALGPTNYPGMVKYMAGGGDTLASVEKKFYGQASPQGEHAIVDANEVFRRARNVSEVTFLPFRVYWIPWNPAQNHTVTDFLAEVNKTIAANPNKYAGTIGSHYAWWETPNHVYLIAMGGSFLLVGLAWPAFLQLMVKGGFGGRKQRVVAPRQYQSEPEPAAAKATVSAGDMQRLRDLEESLTASIKAGGMAMTTAVAATEAQEEKLVIKKLDGITEPPAPMPAVEEEKDFSGGVFYPVAKPHVPPKH